MAGEFGNPEVVQEDLDILLIGGGMACCGAGYEVMRWADAAKAESGVDLKIKLVDKAALDRSGAVAQGLSAINTYIGDAQDPADYARMVSNDLMGITRDDLAFDLESFSTASSGPATLPGTRAARRPRPGALVAAAACVGAGLLAGALLFRRAPQDEPTFHRLTFRRGNVLRARFAPDGRTIVYGAAWGGVPSEVFTVR